MKLQHADLLSFLMSNAPNARKKYTLKQKFFGDYAFIHINKCGGTSVESALNFPIKIHETALQTRALLGNARWQRLFSFSIVRNPYARVRSHYRYRVKTNQTGLAESRLSLNEWVYRSYGDKDPIYYDQPLMFAPCATWLTDEDGQVIVDFIARLENIEEDWLTIRKKLELQVDLPKHNATVSQPDGEDDLSLEAEQILEAHFAEDFEHFGYERLNRPVPARAPARVPQVGERNALPKQPLLPAYTLILKPHN